MVRYAMPILWTGKRRQLRREHAQTTMVCLPDVSEGVDGEAYRWMIIDTDEQAESVRASYGAYEGWPSRPVSPRPALALRSS